MSHGSLLASAANKPQQYIIALFLPPTETPAYHSVYACPALSD